jgi:leader peptidase (prepilin peptidase)/N-methyltransferase
MIVAAVLIGAFGSLIGSFLNVVVFRVPRGRSVVSPPSACPGCGHEIRAIDNVPVISWLVLRGRCRECHAPISVRYPLVELGTAVFFTVVALFFAPAIFAAESLAAIVSAIAVLVAFLYLAAISIALALIDIDTNKLPNRIVLPAYAVGAALLSAASLLSFDLWALARAAIGAAALFVIYLAIALAKPGGMGFGDVKLAGVLGLFLAWLGWEQLAVGALAAFILGGLFSVGLLITRKAARGTAIPFGPWMLAGAWVGALVGVPIVKGYLGLVGLG